jgi:OPA family glycerol-3-phosphate transporter-like MFS transporter
MSAIRKKTKSKHLIFLLCWLVYAFAYFSRVNISIILPELQHVFGWTTSQIGLIGSGFFWVYGIGHFINGYIGDKVSGKWYVFIGAFLIAISNLLAGFAKNLPLLVIIWSVHGFFQSMIWGPMIRILTNWYEESSRGKVATAISTSMVTGYFLAWGLIGPIMSTWGWKFGFWVPGFTILLYSLFWLSGIRDSPNHQKIFTPDSLQTERNAHAIPFRKLIKKTNLHYVILACVSKGIVKEGITLWGPLLIMEQQGIGIESSYLLILVIPVMNLIGILLTGWLTNKLNNNDSLIISISFATAGLACYGLIFFGHNSVLLSVILLGVASAMLHGANTILMGSIPMKFKKYNRTSAVAGILDSISYIAAGISITLSGVIIDLHGWNGVLLFWVIALFGGLFAMAKYSRAEKKTILPVPTTKPNFSL